MWDGKEGGGFLWELGNGFFVLFSIAVEMIPKANIIGNFQHFGAVRPLSPLFCVRYVMLMLSCLVGGVVSVAGAVGWMVVDVC